MKDCGYVQPGEATKAGWLRHWRNNEEACQACRDASALYMREYRRNGGNIKGRIHSRAQILAFVELKHRHQDEFDEILGKHLRLLGYFNKQPRAKRGSVVSGRTTTS
jgi:hypothetical protein